MQYIHLAILWPLIGMLVNGFLGRYLPRKLVGFIGCFSVFLSFMVSLYAFVMYLGSQTLGAFAEYEYYVLPWIQVAGLKVNYGFLVDPLSLLMALTVSLVSFLVHVYSLGYMAEDDGYSRFFAYLNLFVAMMLTLVLANNLVLMFIGWEGVGLCSYLLIGFWYRRKAPPLAGMKAFVVNRLGDFGFLIGIFLTFWFLHSTRFTILRGELGGPAQFSPYLFTAIALFLFLGAIGKSAQFPLHVWLPDAMEGPTPVSALIHAATMVTAGVYMVARLNFLFTWSAFALVAIAILGGFTAVLAASIALVQNDIKRMLAYSTISQLGYMFLAAGLGAFWIAVFHLFTHAFFKALLFLSSGSVIHGMHGEMDMRKMGGLAKYMPQTYWNFLIGAMAISGIPLLAGFFSKDAILFAAFQARPEVLPSAGMILWIVGIVTALLTAFYMFRQIYLVFLTPARFDEGELRPRDASGTMLVAMWCLSFGSVFGGYLALPALLRLPNLLGPFLQRTLALGGEEVVEEVHRASELLREGVSMGVSVVLALAGVALAYYLYRMRWGITERLKRVFATPYRLLLNKYYVDEIYDSAVVSPGRAFAEAVDQVVDRGIVDGLVNLVAFVIGAIGQLLRPLQTGFVRNYVWYIGSGAVALVIILWLVRG